MFFLYLNFYTFRDARSFHFLGPEAFAFETKEFSFPAAGLEILKEIIKMKNLRAAHPSQRLEKMVFCNLYNFYLM